VLSGRTGRGPNSDRVCRTKRRVEKGCGEAVEAYDLKMKDNAEKQRPICCSVRSCFVVFASAAREGDICLEVGYAKRGQTGN